MNTAEAAEYLDMDQSTIWRYIRRGALPAIEHKTSTHTRRTFRLLRSDVEAAKARLDAGQPLFTPEKPGRKPRQPRAE